jgi:hypothetical protein
MSMIASTLQRSLDPVSGVLVYSGCNTVKTSAALISSTGMSRIGPAYWSSVCRHCHMCLALRHDGSCAATNSSAIAPKLGFVLGSAAEALRLSDWIDAVNADHLA